MGSVIDFGTGVSIVLGVAMFGASIGAGFAWGQSFFSKGPVVQISLNDMRRSPSADEIVRKGDAA